MNDAVLDFRFGEHCFNRSGKSGQIVRASDENFLNSSIFQAIEYRCPIFGTLIFTEPHAQNVFPAVQINADGDIGSFFHDLPLAADMIVDGIQKDHRVDAPQRPLRLILPLSVPRHRHFYIAEAGAQRFAAVSVPAVFGIFVF